MGDEIQGDSHDAPADEVDGNKVSVSATQTTDSHTARNMASPNSLHPPLTSPSHSSRSQSSSTSSLSSSSTSSTEPCVRSSSNSNGASSAANSNSSRYHKSDQAESALTEPKVPNEPKAQSDQKVLGDLKVSGKKTSSGSQRTRPSTRRSVANQSQASTSSSHETGAHRLTVASGIKSPRSHSKNLRHRENDATGPRRMKEERLRTRSAGAMEELATEAGDLQLPLPVLEPLVQAEPPKPVKACEHPTLPIPVQDVSPQQSVSNKNTRAAAVAAINADSAQNTSFNWQASKTTVKQRLSHMCENELLADVHFLVGKPPGKRIPAHKFVLSIGSAVFDAMFNGAMACESGVVEIPDVEPAAFLSLLHFLYTDEVQIDAETVMTTLYTAKKYSVPALEEACVDFLKRNLSSDNAFMLLTQARLFDEPQLAALCLEMIDKNTSEALMAEGFTDIDADTLSVVLDRDTLGIRESKLFTAAKRWAEAECIRQDIDVTPANQRTVLGRLLYQIRFPLMTVEEFAMGPAQSGLLQDRELVELFLHFTVSPKPRVAFQDTPRCCLTGMEQVVCRFCHVENRWGYSGTSDRIRFTVNRRVFVVGFGLYGSIHGPAEYSVNIQVIQTDSGNICGQNDTTFQSDGTMATFRVMFKEPVEIQPNTSYTACATLKGPDSYYGTKGLRKVTHESVNSGKVTFQFTYAAGNNNGTSVEDGQLPEIVFYT